MPAQPGYGRQFDKTHAVTVTAQAAIVKNRFVAFNGEHAAQLPTTGAGDCQGVSEESAALGEAVSLVTGYSYLVEASATIAFGDYIRPAADGSGKAAVGTLTDHCGRALGAGGSGALVEVQILPHRHP